jgi:hypothetical protein
MLCHAMHPIQDLFLESFSYVLQFDMHYYMHSYVDRNLILVKSGCYPYLAISRFILVHQKFFFKSWYILLVLR